MRTNRLLPLFGLGLLTMTAFAQAPQGFSYQAVARDTDGDAVAGQPIEVQFVLHQGNALGAVVYAETHSTSTNGNGLFALTVGGGSTGTGTFSSIDWGNGPYFIEVGLDIGSSGGFTNVGTQQLMSVPYALYAGKSNVPDGTEVGQILHWDGNAWMADTGLYVHAKRFGIGVQQPEAPLGIRADGSGKLCLSYLNENTPKWNCEDRALAGGPGGLHWVDLTANGGTGASRLFIQDNTGHIGLGTNTPDAALTIRSSTPLKQHFQNGDVPTQSDFWNTIDSYGFNTGQGNPDTGHVHLTLQSMTGHLGLGTNDPPAPLSIKSRTELKTYFETGDVPTQDQFGFTSDGSGFGIGQGAPDALSSRLFIQASNGHVGLGTVTPEQKLHVQGANDGGAIGLQLTNTAASADGGWLLSAIDDNAVPERQKTFAIQEKNGVELAERLTVLPGGNVGISESVPDVKLHVSRSLGDPSAGLDLLEGTGIMVLGPMSDNVVADYRGIQARHGEYVGDVLNITASDLNLQRLGGNILIHGDAAAAPPNRGIITHDARLGLGTITPVEKIEVDGAIKIGNSVGDNDGTIRYTGTDFEGRKGGQWRSLTTNTNTDGFVQGSTPDAIHYSPASGGRVGINEPLPYATLHVSRPVSDPSTPISLSENSGIVVVGPTTDNLVMDHQGIQARIAMAGGTSTTGSAGSLHLQPLGGPLLIHGDSSIPETERVTISTEGKIGVGKTPAERLDVNGAITIGNSETTTPANGTIRWNGSDFQGRSGNAWTSLGSKWEKVDNTEDAIHYSASSGHPKVGIGIAQPNATLHVRNEDPPSGPSTAMFVDLIDSSVNLVEDRDFIGLRIYDHSESPGTGNSRNIGLYVAEVSGQSSAERNLAAVLNGNVVVGDISGQTVGTGGTNVLAIQNGAVPAPPSSTPNGGIQIYSSDLAVVGQPVFHVMNGDGTVIKLYQAPAITPADGSSVAPVYDPTTAALIENMRVRINELEAILKAQGLLAP